MLRSRVTPVSLQDAWMQIGHARWMGEPSSSWKKFQRWWRKTTMRTLCLVSTLKGLITRWKQPIAHLEQTSDKLILWQLRDKYHKIIFWYTFLKKKKENPVKINQAQFIFVFFLFFRFNVWALCPKGFYMNGIRTGSAHPWQLFLNNIEEARCCHPTDHQNFSIWQRPGTSLNST